MAKVDEINAVKGTQLVVVETEVFNGNTADPAAWTDLDLHTTIGEQATLVLLKFGGNVNAIAVRKDGDTDQFWSSVAGYVGGCALVKDISGTMWYALLVVTNDAGVIEWKAEKALRACTIDVIAYIK